MLSPVKLTERAPSPLNSLRRLVFEEARIRIYEKSKDMLNNISLACQSCGIESNPGNHDVRMNPKTQDAIWFCKNESCNGKINRVVLGIAEEEISHIVRTLINAVSVNEDFTEEAAASDPQGVYIKILELMFISGHENSQDDMQDSILEVAKRAANLGLSTSAEDKKEELKHIDLPRTLERGASIADIVVSFGYIQRVTMKQIPMFISLGKSEEVMKGIDAIGVVISGIYKFLNAGYGSEQVTLLFKELKNNFNNSEISQLLINLAIWKKSIEFTVDTLPVAEKNQTKIDSEDGRTQMVSRPEKPVVDRDDVVRQLATTEQQIQALIKALAREF
ncbi:MAG: hypothetical protein A2418_02245 [Candidatus Brennerbacteria bacterium RIFOXYC1_FULL_41_11]|uniref:Uncharacterized protein n=1 Tax=Candidatus Brennerbacteria bacterium RIFOXYD1_FULL_41_16 TaxID=1797529 RepID=A0A1G1XM62_9BACT|nr:MAG: hypothetical protein A2391_00340 [Candidatus Brennerbacteria bacterium RIFOXYB1_FULL_41_13]OGY40141.1 MAG: hypothetical protein A2418_02245 [Candidatus Brennerbacteria bacterium RIFOXYC1_FULL_41_11]OGY41004.1 MAG: hypothetical protein A2570_01730 [Candidatus Brennerbacteria bacterium RIFOXYD1_FULL_41_16]